MRILVGITGGIAAYKSAQIVRSLTELGHDVKVLPTANALKFIGSATLEALSHNSIDPDLYTQVADVKHIKLAQEAELVIIAPATAAFLARYANGIADDLLLNVLLATTAPVVIAPAMHSEMWNHPATKKNTQALISNSVHIIEPGTGRLTGNDTGVGRMAEPSEIVSRALSIAKHQLDLAGKAVVVAAGGTREPIDSVRFIGNYSSGRQGIALATSARDRGAKVTLISANIDVPLPAGIEVVEVTTHAQLDEAIQIAIQDCDALIMPAAVSDFRVAEITEGKIHRSVSQELEIKLIANSDILAKLTSTRTGQRPIVVGFAAEVVQSQQELEIAGRKKLDSKGCDLIVANNVSNQAIFRSDDSQVLIIDSQSSIPITGTKHEVAEAVLDRVASLLAS